MSRDDAIGEVLDLTQRMITGPAGDIALLFAGTLLAVLVWLAATRLIEHLVWPENQDDGSDQ